MSAAVTARVTVFCDAPSCRNRKATRRGSVASAREQLAAEGWLTAVHGWRVQPQRDGRGRFDFCPEHHAMVSGREPCPDCGAEENRKTREAAQAELDRVAPGWREEIARQVRAAPPLTETQRTEIARLLRRPNSPRADER